MSLRSAWNAIAAVLAGQDRSAPEQDRTSAPQQAGDGDPAGAHQGRIEIAGDVEDNSIAVGENITLTGTIRGHGNVIRIAGTHNPQTLNLQVFGNSNEVSIGAGSLLQNLRIEIGSVRWPCSRARVVIGKGFSIASQGRFILPNSGNVLEIGDDCMFSANVVVRGGEYPHLIFAKDSGEYLDVSDGIFIGNHVWVGEGAFIGKAVTLPDDCIVGTRGVVTRRFDEPHCVIAGNPARIVKRAVQWVANEYMLERQFPLGHASFAQTGTARINRAQRASAEAEAPRDGPIASAQGEPDE